MQLFPAHEFGIQNAWLFSLIYGIVSLLIMTFTSKERRKRILSFPEFKNKKEKIFTILTLFVFARGLIVYSFFIPVKIDAVNFFIGTAIYLIGMLLSVYAIWTFSKAGLSRPVTNGIYKITRHPMQVMSFVMWAGVGIASWNWIVIAITVLLAIISLPAFKAQERFCIEKYGQEYLDYMERVPRYLLA